MGLSGEPFICEKIGFCESIVKPLCKINIFFAHLYIKNGCFVLFWGF